MDMWRVGKLCIQVQGELGNITLAGLQGQINDHLRMLQDYDCAISRETKASVEWLVTNVSIGSLTIETESRSLLRVAGTRSYPGLCRRRDTEGTAGGR